MPGGFPLGPELCNGNSQGVSAGTNYGTAVASSSSANTMGTWTEIVASTPYDACWMVAEVEANGSFSDWAINIGIGGAGSEQPIWSNLYLGTDVFTGKGVIQFSFPCNIPAGTRIAAQLQSSGYVALPETAYLTLQLFDGAFTQMEGASGVEAVGFTAASTIGTTIAPGGTINTKGSYAQLTAATGRDYMGFSLGAGHFAPFGNPMVGIDIAIGASGSEQIILPDFVVVGSSYGLAVPPLIFPIPIPAGTRIAARCETNGGTTSTYDIYLTLNGIFK